MGLHEKSASLGGRRRRRRFFWIFDSLVHAFVRNPKGDPPLGQARQVRRQARRVQRTGKRDPQRTRQEMDDGRPDERK